MALPLCRTDLSRATNFGFICNRCLSCCSFKKIQLNPYEIARLAGNLGLSTTEFIPAYTTHGGTVLKTETNGNCVFLGAEGCTVHADRPLVCRLYPLGRTVDYLGVESFSQIRLEEDCRGLMGEAGSIEAYLEDQGAFPFMHAADRYLELLWKLLEIIEEEDLETPESAKLLAAVRAVAGGDSTGQDVSWMDMDRVLADYCGRSSIPVPESMNEKMMLHIRAVRDLAA